MSRKITQPVNQVRLTNVAVVRMNRHGKRFEVACYRNKILNYRQQIETDLTEVLQTDRVFTNVSKGEFASSKDLESVFGTSDQDAVCQIILDKGQVQVSDMERSAALENTAREVANMVATKCVHPVSNRPYTTSQVRSAMKEAKFSVQSTSARSVKQQFLACVKAIQEKKVLEIQRAKMELAIVFSTKKLTNAILGRLEREARALIYVNRDDTNTDTNDNDKNEGGRIQFFIDPSQYRVIDIIAKESGATLEVLRHVVTQEGDADVSSELERKNLRQSEHVALLKRNANKNGNNLPSQDVVSDLANVAATLALGKETFDGGKTYETERKKNTKLRKKSKKAKRREKEEMLVRQARIDAEKARREERNIRLGNERMASSNSAVGNEGPLKGCNTCGGSFTPIQYRNHFRTDWHRYNMTLKMKGAKPIEEKEFLMIDSNAFFEDGV